MPDTTDERPAGAARWPALLAMLAPCALLVASAGGVVVAIVLSLRGAATGAAWVAVAASVCAWGAVLVLWRAVHAAREREARLAVREERRADQVATLSHEIRTPLAIIQGAAELLAEPSAGELTARQQGLVRRIIDNAFRTHTLAEQLLTRARIEAGVFTIEPVDVDLRRLFRELVEELSQIVDTTIVLDSPGAPISAHADPQLVRQVVSNLVINAARSESAGGRVEVRIMPGDDRVIVSVSDGGTGMSVAQRERLFARFSSGQPLGNGTGIGLFVSQQLVELHGGRIYVDTITGKGTTMMFTLPRTERAHG